ncbi:uncharacterized protein A4U43_C06F18360 [Asparagus officinalis]|uniref:WEB family protein n=1 Tax=Asparagus officinalis TaxID=4686 RepID=A0A5P1EMV6_ASPOF|nr:uncharacterized protein A4U43_C06F18360 [Asparagus officinalis]
MDELKNDEAQSSGDSSLVTPNFPSFSEKTEVDDSKMGDRNNIITRSPPVAVGRSRAKTLSAETLERMNKGIIDTAQPIDSVKSAVITSELASAKKELEEVKITIQKSKEEINFLKEAASSLKAELDRESEALTTLRQREGVSSVTVSSLEAELTRTQSELELVLTKEKEAREKMEHLPKLVQQANVDAGQAKSVADLAREELRRAKEEAEQAKAGAITMETRLLATLKEIEAANASEALAVAAVKTMIESDAKKNANANAADEIDSDDQVTLQLEEYYALSKKAHDAEESASGRVISAVEKIKQAKICEQTSLERLEEVNKQLEEEKKDLKVAVEMADKASEGKMAAEQELRDWRASNEQRRRASDAVPSHLGSPPGSSDPNTSSGEAPLRINSVSCPDLYAGHSVPESKQRRKKSFFPRIVMFLARKKAQSLK